MEKSATLGHLHFEKATDALKDDHETIERVLDVLQSLMKNARVSPLDVWAKAIDFIRHFADKCHHLKEEKILFPALETRGIPVDGGPIGMMLFEHEQGRAYVRNMAEALELAKQGAEAALPRLFDNAAAYSRLLREHIEKENEILFQMADAVLTPEEQKDLLRAFEELEARDMGPGVHEKYLAVAAELEKHDAGRAS
jgi:hemerythrin-like domain-containing protein